MTDVHNTDYERREANQTDAKHRADEARKADEQRRADTQGKLDEQREAEFEAEGKRREEEHQALGERRDAVRKYQDAQRKETDRRAELSPPERLAEDEKRAAMTPEERAEDDEGKGLLPPPDLRDGEINQLAATPQYQVLNSPHPAAEFILTEANGQRSRENAYLADPVSVVVGQPLKRTVAATATTFATYVPATAGADCDALAIYAGGSTPTNGLRISVITRDAEVNGNCIVWGAITAPEQALAIAHLETRGILVRY